MGWSRLLPAWVLIAFIALPSGHAAAWADARLVNASAHVRLLDGGKTATTLTLDVHVRSGWLTQLELLHLGDAVMLQGDGVISVSPLNADSKASVGRARVDGDSIFVDFNSNARPRAGMLRITVRYTSTLPADASEVVAGTHTRRTWSMPRWAQGVERAEIVVTTPFLSRRADQGVPSLPGQHATTARDGDVSTHRWTRTPIARGQSWTVGIDIPLPALAPTTPTTRSQATPTLAPTAPVPDATPIAVHQPLARSVKQPLGARSPLAWALLVLVAFSYLKRSGRRTHWWAPWRVTGAMYAFAAVIAWFNPRVDVGCATAAALLLTAVPGRAPKRWSRAHATSTSLQLSSSLQSRGWAVLGDATTWTGMSAWLLVSLALARVSSWESALLVAPLFLLGIDYQQLPTANRQWRKLTEALRCHAPVAVESIAFEALEHRSADGDQHCSIRLHSDRFPTGLVDAQLVVVNVPRGLVMHDAIHALVWVRRESGLDDEIRTQLGARALVSESTEVRCWSVPWSDSAANFLTHRATIVQPSKSASVAAIRRLAPGKRAPVGRTRKRKATTIGRVATTPTTATAPTSEKLSNRPDAANVRRVV